VSVVFASGEDEREGEDLGAGVGGLVDEVGQVVAAAVGGCLAAEQVGGEVVAVLRARKVRSQVRRTSTLLVLLCTCQAGMSPSQGLG